MAGCTGAFCCPLCGSVLDEPYTSPKIVLAAHLVDSHIVNAKSYTEMSNVAVRCSCGKDFRGIHSLAVHFLEDNEVHESGNIEFIPLRRGKQYHADKRAKRLAVETLANQPNTSAPRIGSNASEDA